MNSDLCFKACDQSGSEQDVAGWWDGYNSGAAWPGCVLSVRRQLGSDIRAVSAVRFVYSGAKLPLTVGRRWWEGSLSVYGSELTVWIPFFTEIST